MRFTLITVDAKEGSYCISWVPHNSEKLPKHPFYWIQHISRCVDHDYQEFGKLGFTQKLNGWLKVGKNGRNWQKRRFSGKNSPKIQKQIDYGRLWSILGPIDGQYIEWDNSFHMEPKKNLMWVRAPQKWPNKVKKQG